MKYIFICLTFLLSAGLNNAVLAQDNQQETLHVTTTAEVQLPADLIQFSIIINTEADSPQEAYQKQQELEEVLVSLLEKYDIKEENIQFEPLSINEYRTRDEGDSVYYQTRQVVRVTFSNFDIYEEIQIALIKNGFDNFRGNFMATQMESGTKQALLKAIDKAKTTAQLMAKQAGVVIDGVSHISYSERVVRPYAEARAMSMAKTDGLLQYNQVVTVSATVSMEFEIDS